jgi:hypothetical protein
LLTEKIAGYRHTRDALYAGFRRQPAGSRRIFTPPRPHPGEKKAVIWYLGYPAVPEG